MLTREKLKILLIKALNDLGGEAWAREVSKYVWMHYEQDLKESDDLLYTWQYDI